MRLNKPSTRTPAPMYVSRSDMLMVGVRLTPFSPRSPPTLPSISTNSAPILRLRNTGRLGSPLLTQTEIAPLHLRLPNRTVTRLLGAPVLFSPTAAPCPHLPSLVLLPYLPTPHPVF